MVTVTLFALFVLFGSSAALKAPLGLKPGRSRMATGAVAKVGGVAALSAMLSSPPAWANEEAADAVVRFAPRGITTEDTVVFVIGMVPFVWATIEFWRRIAVGESFGTGKDSVIIRDTSGPEALGERRRVLGQDAIITARFLFAAVGISLVLVGYAGYQALYPMSDLLPPPVA
ncbi:hypothetical protein T492DRAFT_1024104 [Pavlovales sp. CCMP2436]|nr:hypothetical protein T492DRAFT_1024104 [Pavlovales sp. CCMP2436]|mmetsp:Transcript_11076/g.27961  ORF Transcript_11076/g.27961 Transcript_11076/m.27961 type:complete len:173 (+) Transcript_11076:106-624(+)